MGVTPCQREVEQISQSWVVRRRNHILPNRRWGVEGAETSEASSWAV